MQPSSRNALAALLLACIVSCGSSGESSNTGTDGGTTSDGGPIREGGTTPDGGPPVVGTPSGIGPAGAEEVVSFPAGGIVSFLVESETSVVAYVSNNSPRELAVVRFKNGVQERIATAPPGVDPCCDLASDADRFYFGIHKGGLREEVLAVPKTGSNVMPSTIGPPPPPPGMGNSFSAFLVDDRVYFAGNLGEKQSVYVTAKTPGATAQVLGEIADRNWGDVSSGIAPSVIALGASDVVVATSDALVRVPRVGGSPVIITPVSGTIGAVTVANEIVYLTTVSRDRTHALVQRIPVGGGNLDTLAVVTDDSFKKIDTLAVDASRVPHVVYFGSGGGSKLRRVTDRVPSDDLVTYRDLEAGGPGLGGAHAIAIHGEWVYTSVIPSSIRRAPR